MLHWTKTVSNSRFKISTLFLLEFSNKHTSHLSGNVFRVSKIRRTIYWRDIVPPSWHCFSYYRHCNHLKIYFIWFINQVQGINGITVLKGETSMARCQPWCKNSWCRILPFSLFKSFYIKWPPMVLSWISKRLLNVLSLTLLQLLVGDANYKRGEIGHPLSDHNYRINEKRSEEINVF